MTLAGLFYCTALRICIPVLCYLMLRQERDR
jgi:hypothetical protein